MNKRILARLCVAAIVGVGMTASVAPGAQAIRADFSNVRGGSDTVPDRHPGAYPCGSGCWESRNN